LGILYLKIDCNNQSIIEHLPNSIEQIELDFFFDLELNNLPCSIKKITFDKSSMYNKKLNCLPKFIEIIKLPQYYDNKIKIIPSGLKKIICHEKYKYSDDFANCQIETYK
jgi:hypothetical protein